MFQHIEKVKKMPIQKRKLIAFLLSLLLTSIIVAIWFFTSFQNDLNKLNNKNERKWGTPTETFYGTFKNSIKELKGTFKILDNINLSPILEYVNKNSNEEILKTSTNTETLETKDTSMYFGPKEVEK